MIIYLIDMIFFSGWHWENDSRVSRAGQKEDAGSRREMPTTKSQVSDRLLKKHYILVIHKVFCRQVEFEQGFVQLKVCSLSWNNYGLLDIWLTKSGCNLENNNNNNFVKHDYMIITVKTIIESQKMFITLQMQYVAHSSPRQRWANNVWWRIFNWK